MTLLESLKRYTTVVADTGDIEAIAQHRPQNATTNPSLLFQAAQLPAYRHLLEEATEVASEQGSTQQRIAFRWMHNEDAMATEKLAEGIRKFNSDAHRSSSSPWLE